MKRKLPVLIAIILALVIALAACQPLVHPVIPGNQSESQPSYAETTPATTAPTVEPQLITMDEAIAIALKDAGFSEKDVTGPTQSWIKTTAEPSMRWISTKAAQNMITSSMLPPVKSSRQKRIATINKNQRSRLRAASFMENCAINSYLSFRCHDK